MLISPGRGLLWYSPAVIAVAAVPGAVFKRWESRLIVAVEVGGGGAFEEPFRGHADPAWGGFAVFHALAEYFHGIGKSFDRASLLGGSVRPSCGIR